MSFRHTTGFTVEFGDCDPLRIVFYPNFFRWMDAAFRQFFVAAGVPSWYETERTDGIFGAPLVDASARFLKPATFGDRIAVDTGVAEWRGRSFVVAHVIRRADEVLVEGREVRILACRHPDDPARIRAAAVPDWLRAKLG